MFLLNSKTEWNDYFPIISPSQTYGSSLYTTKQSPSGPNVYVSNCLFSRCTSTSNGGAFSCTSVKCLLIESSSFFTCSTSDRFGGVIYTTGVSECILYKVCGSDCLSTFSSSSSYSGGQFAQIYTNNVASDKNYFNYSSVVRCVNEIMRSYHVLDLKYGNICCPSINVSVNRCSTQPVIWCVSYKNLNYVTCSLTYSSFADNNATLHNCFYIGSSSEIYEIKSCNILRNTQVVPDQRGIILTCGSLTIKDSCILENRANRIFYTTSSSYTITLSNCTVDTVTQSVTLINTVTKSFIHALKHMSTQNCHSGYDSVGSQTAVPPPKEKTLYCHTCKIIYYRARISDFFSFHCIFIFSFIHSDN
jgi:hypothetical protein